MRRYGPPAERTNGVLFDTASDSSNSTDRDEAVPVLQGLQVDARRDTGPMRSANHCRNREKVSGNGILVEAATCSCSRGEGLRITVGCAVVRWLDEDALV